MAVNTVCNIYFPLSLYYRVIVNIMFAYAFALSRYVELTIT